MAFDPDSAPNAQAQRVALILDDGKRPCSLGCVINTQVGGDHAYCRVLFERARYGPPPPFEQIGEVER